MRVALSCFDRIIHIAGHNQREQIMQHANDILRVILLGTGIPNPDINAFGTATIIEAGSQRVLLDCGRGTVIRMAQLGIPLGAVDEVFLSHFHSDHYAGLFDLLMTGTIP